MKVNLTYDEYLVIKSLLGQAIDNENDYSEDELLEFKNLYMKLR